jgi:predicted polyphosphate/ATP-dependent NAD kinase
MPPRPDRPRRIRLGLIVNPVAGIGGRVGLKGSDGQEILGRAIALGAEPVAPVRARVTLDHLADLVDEVELATYPGPMGADVARAAGFAPTIVGALVGQQTTADDTRRACSDLKAWGVDLVIFVGGDGTARDVCGALGDTVPVLGVPAGVKIHSSVFALNARRAAELVRAFIRGPRRTERREVLDIDEDLFRVGIVSARLYGELLVPYDASLVQRAKAASHADTSVVRSVAFGVLGEMDRDPDAVYVMGPGSTIKAVTNELGLDGTLLGVDLVHRGELVGKDLGEAELLRLIDDHAVKIVVTVIGGQGYLFGRGNQQISPRVIFAAGRENILVAATADKLHELGGPLLVDTGSAACDRLLTGYVRVITGEYERVMWRVAT